ncbi:MAG: hypothetical protein AAF202_00790 [Pseudomonadota bacterium]
MQQFFKALFVAVVLALPMSSFAAVDGCIEPGDINDDRLRFWSCELSEDNFSLQFDVEGYKESFLRDGRSNRATLSVLSVSETWVRIYVGNTVRAQAYSSSPKNDESADKYCDGYDPADSLYDFETLLELHQDPDSTGSFVGDVTGFKRFSWTKENGEDVVLKCNKKWF